MQVAVDYFVNFVETFDSNQFKIGEKSINTKVNTININVGLFDIRITSEFVDKLKSIPVVNNISIAEAEGRSPNLLDHLILDIKLFKQADIDILLRLLNQEWIELEGDLNPLNVFKRLKILFDSGNYSKFKMIQNSFPFCEQVEFTCYFNNKDFETMTNPILYQNGVKSFNFANYSNDKSSLTDKLISNIWNFNPKSLFQQFACICYPKPNLIKILPKLPNNMKYSIGEWHNWNSIKLWFSNTILMIIQSDWDEPLFLKWKLFNFEINNDNLWGIRIAHNDSEPYSDWLILSLDNSDLYGFEEFSPFLTEKANEINELLSFSDWNSDSYWTVAVLAKDLIKIKLELRKPQIENPDETVVTRENYPSPSPRRGIVFTSCEFLKSIPPKFDV